MVIDDRAFPDKKTPNPKDNSSVERLEKFLTSLQGHDFNLLQPRLKKFFRSEAKKLNEMGLIFKSEAVEHVELCDECYGLYGEIMSDCPKCQGRGLILKGDS